MFPLKNGDFPWFFVCLPAGNIHFPLTPPITSAAALRSVTRQPKGAAPLPREALPKRSATPLTGQAAAGWGLESYGYQPLIIPNRIMVPSGELTKSNGKSPCLMGKSTISMAIFNCYLYVHQRVNSTYNGSLMWIQNGDDSPMDLIGFSL